MRGLVRATGGAGLRPLSVPVLAAGVSVGQGPAGKQTLRCRVSGQRPFSDLRFAPVVTAPRSVDSVSKGLVVKDAGGRLPLPNASRIGCARDRCGTAP